ncbi:MAG: NADH-quinone oxidoreductase subunit E, partial [Candidatus Eremiobacteraeota bacterium]|nr:NADH-quinone oxidoreductase subunit E [Candidatus Eremiobacteraeota bacterium]
MEINQATTTSAINFPELVEELRPQCEAIVAQYEQKRSALLPMMHLFQQHQGYVSV